MQTVRVITVIDAPGERCYRLALNVGLTRESMKPGVLEGEGTSVQGEMSVNDVLRWSAFRSSGSGQITETLTALRPRVSIRRSLAGDRIAWGEIDQHFAPMNDGTRLQEEMRFAVKGWWLRGFRESRLRAALLQMMKTRSEALKEAAEGDGWKQYLGEDAPGSSAS